MFFIQPQQLDGGITEATETFQMDQDSFRALYDRTARPLWVYLYRRTNDSQAADDLLQETYYRFLRTRSVYESESHRKNYLFRIAANLVNDSHRQRRDHIELSDEHGPGSHKDADAAGQSQRRTDLARALEKLKPRQRDALWMAYAEGSSHEEIAQVLGVKANSIKLILFRAKRKLALLLRGERA